MNSNMYKEVEEDEPAMKKITSGYRNRRESWVEWHQEGTLEKKKETGQKCYVY